MFRSDDSRFQVELARHRPALEADPARHNLILGLIERVPGPATGTVWFWGSDAPGACALLWSGRNIVLGDLGRKDALALAAAAKNLPFEGIVGPDDGPRLLAEAFAAHAITFGEPLAQAIHSLDAPPIHPRGAMGSARPVGAADTEAFASYMLAFCREAVPHDPVPTPEQMAATAASGRYLFWAVEGRPVSMAGRTREGREFASIAGVYTPPEERGKGYAGSVTAALCEKIFASGRKLACLYTDLSNPYSNRCYAKIGFVPVCTAQHYVRKSP